MEYLTQKKFSFTCDSLDSETFGLISFTGFEAISKPYEFDIMLVTGNPDIDMDAIMNDTVHLIIHAQDEDITFNGVLSQFDQLHQVDGFFFYRAILVPRLWWLSLNRNNQVFIDLPIIDTMSFILNEARLLRKVDFDFQTLAEYLPKEYVCQYGESHLNFLCRWLEYEGIYYFFEQTENGEKLIFTDTNVTHGESLGRTRLSYMPSSAMGNVQTDTTISVLTCRQRQLPHEILLKDYNYERPSLDIQGKAVVDENGRGSVYSYGEHFLTPEEGNRLAALRAQELICRKKEFFGESSVPYLSTGHTFNLTDHFTSSFNQEYLVTGMVHKGSQTGYLVSGISNALANMEKQVVYQNTFTAIPASAQFRPERKAPRPNISGTIHAAIDAEGEGDHPELDVNGRYKVRLPFDISPDHNEGKASCFVRMLQPNAGPLASAGAQGPSGVHFPLRKGTEVLLSFINGDPDRPLIAGSVPNPQTLSPVTESNQTKSIMRDHYGNELIFDASPGDEHIRLYSPHHDSGLVLGKSINFFSNSDKNSFNLGNYVDLTAGMKVSGIGGLSVDGVLGARLDATIGAEHNIMLGGSHSWTWGYRWALSSGPLVLSTRKDALITAREDIILGAGDEFCIAAGTQKGKDNHNPDDKNKSILRATRKGLTLSLGTKLTETSEGDGKASWFKPEGKMINMDTFWALASLAAIIISGGFMLGATNRNSENDDIPIGLEATGTAIWALALTLPTIVIDRRELKDNRLEPVAHNDPPQKIWMHERGTIGIVSTEGGKVENEGSYVPRIILGVNKQAPGKKNSNFFYNKHTEFAPKHEVFKKLGEGFNIIIEKDGIYIRNGAPDDKEPMLELKVSDRKNKKGIFLISRDPKHLNKATRISISKGNGNILLDNEKREGETTVKSKDISLDAKDIILNAKKEIVFTTKEFKVNGKIVTKNLVVKK